MSIRSTAKALIINDGKVLLNKCNDKINGDYYSLPGGGQRQYETIYDAIVRECLEETGYSVIPIRFAGLCEVICTHEEFRQNQPDYAHKMYHIFICKLSDADIKAPTELDDMQESSEWIELDSLKNLRIMPKVFGDNVIDIINGSAPIFLGSEFIEYNHG